MRAPVPAALPAEETSSKTQSGIKPKYHGMLHIDMAAKGTGQTDTFNLVRAYMIHQQFHPRIESGFGQLDLANIILCYQHLRLSVAVRG